MSMSRLNIKSRRSWLPAAVLLMILSLAGCGKKKTPTPVVPVPGTDSLLTADYPTDQLSESPLFKLLDTAWLKVNNLPEISGLVRASNQGKGFFWGEQDSGNQSAIYLFDSLGRLRGVKFVPGVFNRDWEDIEGGPGPQTGQYYLYLGDIGDNRHILPFITVYRFPAPQTDPGQWKDSLISQFDAINLIYPDGFHDAEALLVDPRTKDIYILTKDQNAGLYVARYPQNTGAATRLIKLGTLPISTVTAADISPDANGILVKNYNSVFYWARKKDQTLLDCFRQTPLRLAYHKEPQGEAIAWEPDGKGFYTLSEKVGNAVQVLYHYVSR